MICIGKVLKIFFIGSAWASGLYIRKSLARMVVVLASALKCLRLSLRELLLEFFEGDSWFLVSVSLSNNEWINLNVGGTRFLTTR